MSRSGGSVWSSPLHPTTPVITPPSGTAISFTAIQQLQQEQAIRPTPDKRSLKQIQEEEEAHRAEEEFLKWWAAEEERVRSEQTSLEPSTNSQQRKTKGAKGKAPQRGKASIQKHTAIVQTQGTNVVGAGSTSSTSEYLKRPRGDRPRRRTKDRVNGPVTPASEVQGTQ